MVSGWFTSIIATQIQGGIPSSWTGTKAQAESAGILTEQDIEALETVAASNTPWTMVLSEQYTEKRLTLLYRHVAQGYCRLIFGGFDENDEGARFTIRIGDSHDGDDTISFEYEYYNS